MNAHPGGHGPLPGTAPNPALGSAAVPETGARWWVEGERCEVWIRAAGTFGADRWEQAVVRRALPSGVGQAVYVTLLFTEVKCSTPFLTGHPMHALLIRTPSAPGGYRTGDAVELELLAEGDPWVYATVASVGTIEDGAEYGGMRIEFETPHPAAGYGTGALLDMSDPSVRARVRRAVTRVGGVDITDPPAVGALLAGLAAWDERAAAQSRDLADMSVGEARELLRRVARAVAT